MKRQRFHLVRRECRRCGATLWTGSQALVMPPDMKARFDCICHRCWTATDAAELDAMTRARLQAIAQGVAR